MISAEKIYTELLNLYHNSGREFYAEMAAMLEQQTEGTEHSFFTRDEDKWKLISSTVKNRDERDFLRRQIELLGDEIPGKPFSFSSGQRGGIKDHIAIPLSARKWPIAAIWIIEYKTRERIPEKELMRISMLFALFFQLSKEEKNWYMDAGTGLPDRVYLNWILKKLVGSGHSIILCVFRFERYRERLRLCGSEELMREYKDMLEQIKRLQLGNLYSIAYDTVIALSLEEKAEIYARMESLLDDKNGIRAIILYPDKEEDIFASIEKRFSECSDKGVREDLETERKTGIEKQAKRIEDSEEFSCNELLEFMQEE